MATSKFYVGDTPLVRLNCVSTVNTALEKYILYWKPDGTSGVWSASFYLTTYLDYQIPDVTVLDMAGAWKFAGYVVFSGGYTYTGETATQQIFNRGR